MRLAAIYARRARDYFTRLDHGYTDEMVVSPTHNHPDTWIVFARCPYCQNRLSACIAMNGSTFSEGRCKGAPSARNRIQSVSVN